MKIGIITDIHENAARLGEVFKAAEKNQCEELACLGDIVGYDTRFYDHSAERSAGECIGLIRSNCRWIVAGNHDLFASSRFPSWSNGFEYPAEWFGLSNDEKKILSKGRVWCYDSEAQNDLSDNDLEFLLTIPEYALTTVRHDVILFSHYIFPDLSGSTTRYIERNNQMLKHWDFMRSNLVKFSFIGHSHSYFAGFAYRNNSSFLKAFHSLPNNSFNLGEEPVVVILPPVSGEKGRTGFSVLDTENRKLTIIPIST
jgi:predicted phosphodiesterase